MDRASPQSSTPTLAQLEEMSRRKDDAASDIREGIHQAWAMSWLAMQAFEASRSDYSSEMYQEATYIALECIVAKLDEAKSRHDEDYSGVYRAVMSEKGALS